MLIQVCYLIIQGYQDDIMTHDSDFAMFAEELELITGLNVALNCVNKEVDMKEVEELLVYTIERVNEARELILNIYRPGQERQEGHPPVDLLSQVQLEPSPYFIDFYLNPDLHSRQVLNQILTWLRRRERRRLPSRGGSNS